MAKDEARTAEEGAQVAGSRRLGPGIVIAWCLALALFYTLLSGYTYAVGDSVEEVPLVRRSLDPGYCPRDFYVNVSQQFSPATYYAAGVTALARLMPLPVVMLGLTVLFNWAALLVTWFAVRDLIDASDLTALVACAIMTSVASVHPGGSAELMFPQAVPPAAAMPLVLLAMWMALRRRYVIAAALSVPAMLLHPTLGLVCAAVGMGAALLVDLVDLPRDGMKTGGDVIRGGVAVIAVMAAGWLLWMRHWDATLSAEEFINIMADFRTPHHRLPSTFDPLRMLDSGAFIAATVISLVWLAGRAPGRAQIARTIGAAIALTMAVLGGGYLFVEVWPMRSFAALAAFRFLVIPKWFGFMVFAGLIAHIWRRDRPDGSAGGWIIFASNGTLHGTSVLLGHVVEAARARLWRRPTAAQASLLSGIGFLLAAGLWAWRGDLREIALLCLAGSVALLLLATGSALARAAVLGGAVLALLAVIQVNARHSLPFIGGALGELAPEWTAEQSLAELQPVSEFARSQTPEDALFVGPPDFAGFRVTARRSLLADFKCVPFSDEGMAEWYERMQSCYGPIEGGGFDELERMEDRWRAVSDAHLNEIARRWNADYAVLYAGTQTALERVYEGPMFVVVRLPAP